LLKIAVIIDTIPSYRKGFYEALAARKDMKITVFCQSHLPGFNVNVVLQDVPVEVRHLHFWGLESRIVWQDLPVRQLWSSFDVVVLYGNPRFVSNVIWGTGLKWLGKPIVIWGQAHSYRANPNTERIRHRWWRVFDYFLVYTDMEVDYLRRCGGFDGKTIFGMNNGLDQQLIDKAHKQWTEVRLRDWQRDVGLVGKKVLLSVARLVAKNRFDLVIDALPRLVQKRPDLVWAVIGDGDMRESLEAKINSCGLQNNVRWLDAIYDELQLAPWFLSAQVLVHPAAIGLTLLHAFGYGLPVVTHSCREHHGPEFAAFIDGKTGLSFPEGNIELFHDAVDKLLSNDHLRSDIGNQVIDIARTQYNVQVMADRFAMVTWAAARGKQAPEAATSR